ncbi:MAG: SH3 domain-containing protein [Phycisphaerae bacterium]
MQRDIDIQLPHRRARLIRWTARWATRRICLLVASAVIANLSMPSVSWAMDAQTREQVLRDALDAYDQGLQARDENGDSHRGLFRKAADGFEALLADGVSNGYLHYNLANAYLQMDDLGKAILHYRRGERLIGADEQLRANLNFARSLRRNRIESTGGKAIWETVFFWHYETSTKVRLIVGLLAYAGFWLLLTLRVFRKGAGSMPLICLFALFWVAAGTSVAVETWNRSHILEGVTVQNDITVRKGNGEASAAAFRETLHEGVEFTILEERTGWYRIELPDGNTGWIRQSQAAVI